MSAGVGDEEMVGGNMKMKMRRRRKLGEEEEKEEVEIRKRVTWSAIPSASLVLLMLNLLVSYIVS